MRSSDIPTKLPIPFGASAGGGYIRAIPVASQIGINDGAASLHDGFPPLTATPIGAGGIPPSIKDMNGVLFEISAWSRWSAAGAPVYFDAVFAAAIGGYPEGAIVQSQTTVGVLYVSTVDNNTTDPEGGGAAGWQILMPVPATLADLITGTDTAKYATAATLAGLRATVAQVVAGVDAARYLTPASFFGARASAAQILAGTDDHRYLTPFGLAGAFGGAGDGQTIGLFAGYQLKFGTNRVYHPGEGGVRVNYTNPFPTQTLIVLPVCFVNDPNDVGLDMWAKCSTRDRNGFYMNYGASSGGNNGEGFDWVAIGN